ncbi:putative RNA polymerase, Rpb5, RNA polymerase Rpb5 domain superfamily [Helianthus annuus]|nr:putative RNA polymerase, Rpb5, RNA polymerase Rpb5 domain superfamily [Helianthus annuus]
MALSEEEIRRLFRIRRTVMQMLRDRGYLVGEFEINMDMNDLLRKYGENMKREDLLISKAKTNDSSDQIYVFFPEEPKVGVKTLKTYTERMKSENVFRAVLVVRENLTPFARTCMSEIATKFHLEVFQVITVLAMFGLHILFSNSHGRSFLGAGPPPPPNFSTRSVMNSNIPSYRNFRWNWEKSTTQASAMLIVIK